MPADAAEIVRLAGRVEQATGPDRELDMAVHHVIQKRRYRWSEFGGMPNLKDQRQIAVEQKPEWLARVHARGERVSDGFWVPDIIQIPPYTASLDAAMTLVPEGWTWCIPGHAKPLWDCRVTSIVDGLVSLPLPQPCATPALAVCAAALKARARAQHDNEVG